MHPQPLPYLPNGTRLDRYVIEGLLGEGSSAAVYRARCRRQSTTHAVKVLRTPTVRVRQRLLVEGQVQGVLRHANVLQVEDVLEMGLRVALVLEPVNGGTLGQLLESRSLSFAQIDHLAAGIFAGVAHAHAEKLVHRDLKPGNVLLQVVEDRVIPKIADFGLVKAPDHDQDEPEGSSMGTPRYMAPEQIRDADQVDARADVWALGCILYAMVTGQAAFSPDDDDLLAIFGAVIRGQRTDARALRPDVPERMVRAIDAALQVDPQKRAASVAELAQLWMQGADATPTCWPRSDKPVGAETPVDDRLARGLASPGHRPACEPPRADPAGRAQVFLYVAAGMATSLLLGSAIRLLF